MLPTTMKSTKVQNPQRNKCSVVVEKNCLVVEYRVPCHIGPRTIIIFVANLYTHVHH